MDGRCCATGDFVGLAGGFRKTVAARAGGYNVDGGGQVNVMPDGDEDGFHAGARAYDCADGLAAVGEVSVAATFACGFGVLPAQPMFGAADGRDIHQQADVAGDPQAAWVRDVVPVEDQQVRRDSELLESIQHRGRFAEAEQAGHVGEVDGAFGDGVFEDVEVGVAETTTAARARPSR